MGCGCGKSRLPRAPRTQGAEAALSAARPSELDVAISEMRAAGIGLTRDDRAEIARRRVALMQEQGMDYSVAHDEARLGVVRELTQAAS